MSIPFMQMARIGSYVVKQHLSGKKRYPLVLMLEPLFRCNLACQGCGKIDYPDEILNQRLSYEDCMKAIDECGAPAVSIAGGEPLLHREMPQIVKGYIERKKFIILCTNALLLAKKIDQYEPHDNFTWSIHLDGDKGMHDKSVCLEGTYDKAVAALKLAKSKGFRTQINCTLFNDADPERTAKFFDDVMAMGCDGITVSPGYAYERAPNQTHFLNREKTKTLFRDVLSRGNGGKKWKFTQSELFLDFLAGNQTYECSPWSMPARTVFGWQKPCYLLGEGYVETFKELIEGTDWDKYGVGNYEKCANCMVHCGFEGTAVADSVTKPYKLVPLALRGIKTDGAFAPEVDFSKQRPAEFMFSRHVENKLADIRSAKVGTTQAGAEGTEAAE
ncbi:MAG: adenosyl-hopene transferase HpnH [Rhizomicrobium sp.]|nr:adenosyl-hopene transferase HpnH [Rhizomicrobium sp.]